MRTEAQSPRAGYRAGTRPIPFFFVLLVMTGALVDGCGGGVTSRQTAERPVLSQYNGWRISVTPYPIDANRWRPRVRVWPPEVRPENHPGIILTVTDTAADRQAAAETGTAAARRYIDASQPTHQQ